MLTGINLFLIKLSPGKKVRYLDCDHQHYFFEF